MPPAGLLSLLLLAPAAPPAAGGMSLQRGDELTYTGTVAEAVDRPGNRFRRSHALEVRVFVLERRDTSADAAVLTLLRRADDPAVTAAVPALTGAKPDAKPQPPVSRLDLVRIHADGTVHLILPPGPLPLRLAAEVPGRTLPPVPLDSFTPSEFGVFAPRQPRNAIGGTWSVPGPDPARPAEAWQAADNDFVNAERCLKLVMTQQTPDWEKPRGGEVSWQRADTVWASTLDGMARRVHRVVRQRDGIAATPAVWVETKFELKEQTRIDGRSYARYRREIELAYVTTAEVGPLLRDAAKLGPQVFHTRLAKVDEYLKESDPGTPYREAVLALRRQLDAATRGEVTPLAGPGTPPAAVRVPAVGDAVPDIRAGGFTLAANRGKPVVLVFFCPGTETADLSLAVADALQKRYGDRAAVAPLVVFADAAVGVKDRDRLKFTLPVHDGSAAGAAYGVESFPRFLVIDPAGKLHWAFTGVGAETGYLVRDEVDRLLGPVRPTGTTYPIAPGTPRPPERP